MKFPSEISIKTYITHLGFTQKEICDASGISTTRMCGWLMGRPSFLSDKEVQALAEYLELSTEDIRRNKVTVQQFLGGAISVGNV